MLNTLATPLFTLVIALFVFFIAFLCGLLVAAAIFTAQRRPTPASPDRDISEIRAAFCNAAATIVRATR
jgi:hypothetical protein